MSLATAMRPTAPPHSCGPVAHFRARWIRDTLRELWECPICAQTCQPLTERDIDYMQRRYGA